MSLFKIFLREDISTKVDKMDFKKFSKFKWHITANRYAGRDVKLSTGQNKKIYLHREIIQAKRDEIVDHINGDGLDNRRCNLRICSHAQNMRNSKIRIDNKSGFKGVFWNPLNKNWRASIRKDGIKINIGSFTSKSLAAEAYNDLAKTLDIDFYRLNHV